MPPAGDLLSASVPWGAAVAAAAAAVAAAGEQGVAQTVVGVGFRLG